jgi:transcriptional regulator with XRE-family HTH domain
MSELDTPYVSLGNHLKYVREQSKQSLAEVSGAVEIEENQLQRIEAGVERPAEDVLLLLINYFGVHDREAVQLWESANYGSEMPEEIKGNVETVHQDGKPMMMLLAVDTRAIYSDSLEVTVNHAGVTLNFSQAGSHSVARVGMSHSQAARVVDAIQRAMLHSKYDNGGRLLPPPSQK